MNQDVFRKVQPRDYLSQFLERDVRVDGRSISGVRRVSVKLGSIRTAVGSAMVRLGNTSVVAGVQATLSEPAPGNPDKGHIDIAVEIPSIASGGPKNRGNSEKSLILTDFLRSMLATNIDLSTLCIEAEKLVWNLRLSVYCLDNDGNLEDATLLAAGAALHDVLLPTVRLIDQDDTMDQKENQMEDDENDTDDDIAIAEATAERTNRLEVDECPISVSFGLFKEYALIDPSAEEEAVCDSQITFVFRPSGELRNVLKPGGINLSGNLYKSCLRQAQERLTHMRQHLEEAKQKSV